MTGFLDHNTKTATADIYFNDLNSEAKKFLATLVGYDTVKDKKPLVRMIFQYSEIENAHKRAKRGGDQE